MTQELQLFKAEEFAVAKDIGSAVAKSGMFGLDRSEAGTVITLFCSPQGERLFNFLRTYDVVLGKPRKKALACLAEFRGRGGRVKWISTGDDGKEAIGEFTFEGNALTVKFSIDDANKQGLVKRDSAWVKTPGNMMRARCITNAIGMLCPEIVAGVVDGEESEAPAVEPKPILTKVETTPEKKATVVEVATVVEPAPKTETQATPEPPHTPPVAEPVASAPAPTTERFIAKANAQTGKLTPETVEALSNLLGSGENEALAMKWLEKKEWIKPMGAIGELSVARAQKIFDKPNDFLKAIKEAK